MHPVDWTIVLLLNGAVIAYGFYLARSTRGSSDWFLGRRALPWWAIGLSMFATNVDNADLISVTGKTYREGLHILTVYAVGSAAGAVLAAFFVVPAIYRAGFYTNAEYLEARYGPVARVLSALIQIQYRSSMLGLMIWSLHLLLVGLEIMGPREAWWLIIALVVFSGIYTAWGGLKSVVWTDALQGIVMMVGAVIISLAVWQAVGGWNGMLVSLQEIDAREQSDLAARLPHVSGYDGGAVESSPYLIRWQNTTFNLGPWVVALGWTIIGSGYWTVNHTQTMRLMGARSLWDMRMAATVGVAISLPIMIGCACLGIFGRALPEFAQLDDPDSLYPRLVSQYLGVGLKGLVVAGIVAASISTFDSMGSALSAIFTRDIYARLIVTDRNDEHYVLVGRLATVAVLMLGFAYIRLIQVQRNMLDAFTTLIPVFVTPLFTMYVLGVVTRCHRRSGLWGLTVGASYGLLALYCREAPKFSWPPLPLPVWLTDRWAALLVSLLLTGGTMLLVTLVLGRASPEETAWGGAAFREQQGWLARSREALPKLRESPFAGPVPWWARPELYAVALMAVSAYVVFGLFW